METSELQTQFFKETNTECINSLGDFDFDYVEWLQNKTKHLQDDLEKAKEKAKYWESMWDLKCESFENLQSELVKLREENNRINKKNADLVIQNSAQQERIKELEEGITHLENVHGSMAEDEAILNLIKQIK